MGSPLNDKIVMAFGPMRSPQQLIKAFDAATKEKPLRLAADEVDNFTKAMKICASIEDIRFPYMKGKIVVRDADILLKDGIKSPLDQKSVFTNRKDWAEHLKRNGCVEIGNDYNNKKPSKEIHGDFDCRKELAQAVNQVADKYGH